jgi:hypothetical protein
MCIFDLLCLIKRLKSKRDQEPDAAFSFTPGFILLSIFLLKSPQLC